jgi:hypothetical protein
MPSPPTPTPTYVWSKTPDSAAYSVYRTYRVVLKGIIGG